MLSGHSTFMPRITQARNGRVFFAVARRTLTLDTPIGRRMRRRMGAHGTAPVIRVGPPTSSAPGSSESHRCMASGTAGPSSPMDACSTSTP
jgi:hypothetical protein